MSSTSFSSASALPPGTTSHIFQGPVEAIRATPYSSIQVGVSTNFRVSPVPACTWYLILDCATFFSYSIFPLRLQVSIDCLSTKCYVDSYSFRINCVKLGGGSSPHRPDLILDGSNVA